ncbi:MAG: TonB-dependent receptor [Candidatus Poribacteria bacterium]|nr:TonB-dependent receptor [Candidatus Poribacteria bacterium]
MIRHIASIIVAASFTAAAWAGPAIGSSGMPPGAVSSSGFLFSVLTSANGATVLNGLPLSVYIVAAGHLPCEQPAEGEMEEPHAEEETKSGASEIELEKVSVTASRRPEKVIEAPASIAVIEGDQLRAQVAVNQAERLRHLPAVDVASSGIVQANAVVRGFNNVFSTTLLTLVDNRYARIPSLRLNAYSFIPSTDDDIERVEVVLGPGSALYGPNSANGVLHMLTRSPFDSAGTDISVGAGERGILMGSVRHAGVVNEQIGYKLSAQYYQGDDWEFVDPIEQRQRGQALRKAIEDAGKDPGEEVLVSDPNFEDYLQALHQKLTDAGGNPDAIRIGARDYEVDKLSADARLDYRLSDSATAILSGGFVQAKQIELTGLGASSADGWTYSYVQGRLAAGDLFAQAFINMSDAGDSFLLRDGAPIIDKSQVMVAQIQHGTSLGERERLTYGVDALLTRPDTEGTINGSNEEDDTINEIGLYLQSETVLTDQLKLVAAARVDDHSRLADMIFSPRAALVFSPTSTDNLRLTYNRAYSTPSTNNLFLDIRAAQDPFGLGIDVRGSGVPDSGFTFERSENGQPKFRSPFSPLAEMPVDHYWELDDPAFTNVMWGVARSAVIDGLITDPGISALMKSALTRLGLPADEETMKTIAEGLIPQQVDGVKNTLLAFNPNYNPEDPNSQPFLQLQKPVRDVAPMEPTITQTVELGYKGALFNQLVIGVDFYRTNIVNLVGPITAETPNVFLDSETLYAFLAQQLGETFSLPQNQPLGEALIALDGIYEEETQGAVAKNGSGVDEVAYLITNGAARIPLGTVTPNEASDPTAIMTTYRNYGDISLFGADLNLNLFLNENWVVGGTYSFVSEDTFELEGEPNVSLNAPRHKFGARLQYMNADLGALAAELRLRYVNEFPVNSGTYQGVVEQYQTIDVSAGYNVLDNTRLSLSVQNILDDKHIEFIGAPELGRLTIVRLTQSF